jgi:hypothetical protein
MPSHVSLVLIDTEAYVLANNAIQQCMRNFDFDEVVILTDRIELWPQFTTHRIPRITAIDDYNDLILRTVPRLITTNFFIVAQYDGFILRRESFKPEFYDCDYIGALWPEHPVFRVGNGGFSWRSRKLALAAAEIADFRAPNEPEDLFIGRTIRIALESRYGCRFADDETAANFSTEQVLSNPESFGFHGVMHLPQVYRNALSYLVENLPERVLKQRMQLLLLGANFLDANRKMEFINCINTRVALTNTGMQSPTQEYPSPTSAPAPSLPP